MTKLDQLILKYIKEFYNTCGIKDVSIPISVIEAHVAKKLIKDNRLLNELEKIIKTSIRSNSDNWRTGRIGHSTNKPYHIITRPKVVVTLKKGKKK